MKRVLACKPASRLTDRPWLPSLKAARLIVITSPEAELAAFFCVFLGSKRTQSFSQNHKKNDLRRQAVGWTHKRINGRSGGTAEGHIREFQLGFIKALAFAFFLPVVDHFRGLVENVNTLVVGDPALSL